MTGRDRSQIETEIRRWRAAHPDAASRRAAYLRSVPRQVAASMAFEGEPVELAILEAHLKTLVGAA